MNSTVGNNSKINNHSAEPFFLRFLYANRGSNFYNFRRQLVQRDPLFNQPTIHVPKTLLELPTNQLQTKRFLVDDNFRFRILPN